MFYRLTPKQYFVLFVFIIIGYAFTVAQKYFIPATFRPFALFIAIIAVFLGFFHYIKPDSPTRLSKSLSLTLAIAAPVLIVIQHVIISKDFLALIPQLAIVWAIAVISPFISGMLYSFLKRSSSGLKKINTN